MYKSLPSWTVGYQEVFWQAINLSAELDKYLKGTKKKSKIDIEIPHSPTQEPSLTQSA